MFPHKYPLNLCVQIFLQAEHFWIVCHNPHVQCVTFRDDMTLGAAPGLAGNLERWYKNHRCY